MRLQGYITLVVPALCVALTGTPLQADVEVDLSAIGARTDADARIAPGKAPVQLRYPGETPPTRILLTPPASVRQSQEAPKILGPADATVVEVRPAAPTPVAPIAAPVAPAGPPTPQPANRAQVEQVTRDLRLSTDTPQTPDEAPTPDAAPTPVVSTVPTPLQATPTPPVSIPAQTETVVEEPVQVASLPAPQRANHRLRFDGSTAEILGATRDELEMVALELMRHDDRIEIQAFAGEAGDVSSAARRLSLKRALNVREFLVERGVLQSRIDVRALGGTRDSGPAERVDILLTRR
eukprot:s1_g77.t1